MSTFVATVGEMSLALEKVYGRHVADIRAVTGVYRKEAETGAMDRVRKLVEGNAALDKLAAAHLVIGRSGASTMAELAVVGRPSILVPYPFAADDHQTANARAFEAQGACIVIPHAEFTAAALARHKVPYIALDMDAARVSDQRRLGNPVYFGDSANPDLLRRCGIDTARALVVTLDQPRAVEAVVAADAGDGVCKPPARLHHAPIPHSAFRNPHRPHFAASSRRTICVRVCCNTRDSSSWLVTSLRLHWSSRSMARMSSALV